MPPAGADKPRDINTAVAGQRAGARTEAAVGRERSRAHHAAAGRADEVAVAHHELAAHHGGHGLAARAATFVRVVVVAAVHACCLDHALALEVDDRQVGVGADRDGAFAGVHAPDARGPFGRHAHVLLERHVAGVDRVGEKQADARLDAREARDGLPDIRVQLVLERVRRMVRRDGVQLARRQRAQQGLGVARLAHRRVDALHRALLAHVV